MPDVTLLSVMILKGTYSAPAEMDIVLGRTVSFVVPENVAMTSKPVVKVKSL